jgi:hypothetical protein
MANEKILNTRIQLKYDSLSNWNSNSGLVLKKGEVAICAVASGSTAMSGEGTRPQILFKVGDGESTFASLQWVSAKAADVYDWAKQAALPVTKVGTGNVVSSISWDETTKGIKFETIDVATAASFKEVSDNLSELTTKVNAMYTNDKIDELVADAKKAGTDAASALSSYKTTNDVRVEAIEGNIAAINHETTGILAEAKKYTDAEIVKIDSRIDTLESYDHSTYATKTEVANTYATKEVVNSYKTSNDARVEAIEGDIAEITNANNGILKQAKDYTDNKDSAMNDRVAVLEAIKHEEFAKSANVVSNTAFDSFKTSNTIAIEAAEQNAKDYADAIKKEILTGDSTEELDKTYDTLLEIQKWMAGDGVNATELTEAIAAEAKTRGEEDARVAGLVSSETTRAVAAEEAIAADVAKITSGDTVVAKATEATKATQDADGNVITATYETKNDASSKLAEAKGYTDAEIVKAKSYTDSEIDKVETAYQAADDDIKERLDALEGDFNGGIANEAAKVSNALTVKLEGSTKTYDGAAAIEVDLTSYATKTQAEGYANAAKTAANGYTDTAVSGETTRAVAVEEDLAGRIKTVEDNHINSISAGAGLKATKGTNSYEIAFDDTYVFVFNCGSASELVD